MAKKRKGHGGQQQSGAKKQQVGQSAAQKPAQAKSAGKAAKPAAQQKPPAAKVAAKSASAQKSVVKAAVAPVVSAKKPAAQPAPAEKPQQPRSLFEVARQVQAQERRDEELADRDRQKRLAERNYRARENYSKKLEAERRELIRLKQGVITESDTLQQDAPAEKHYTFSQKLSNFFYHNAWWLALAGFAVVLGGYLTYDYMSKEDPDLIVFMVAADSSVKLQKEAVEEYFEQFTPDLNGDGEVKVQLYYMPVSDSESAAGYYNGTDSKLVVEMQSANGVLILSDATCEKSIPPDQMLTDLSEYFPGNAHVDEYRFLLSNTDFMEKIGCGDDPHPGLYLGIRKPQKLLYTSEEKMQKTYDKTWPILEQVIEDLSDGRS